LDSSFDDLNHDKDQQPFYGISRNDVKVRCNSLNNVSNGRTMKKNPIRKLFHENHEPLKRTSSAPLKGLLSSSNHRRPTNHLVKTHSNDEERRLLHTPKAFRGKSLSKLNSEDKHGLSRSRFSLRRTLSASFWNPHKESSLEITFPTKAKRKARQKFRIVEGKTGQPDGISFEVIGKKGSFLRVKGTMLVPDKDSQDSYFNKDCTFVPLPDMWFPTFFAFESVSKPSYFIRLLPEEELVIDKFDGTADFKMEASFQLNRKPCATCLQIGVKTWAKTSGGEFCLGKVISLNNNLLTVKFDDGKTELYSVSDTGLFVPDVIPCEEDINVGTRVLAEWLHRDTLYPGVVVNVRGGDSYDVLFDDGDTGREKAFQIRLMRSYSTSHVHDTPPMIPAAPRSNASTPCCSSAQSTPCGRRRASPSSKECIKIYKQANSLDTPVSDSLLRDTPQTPINSRHLDTLLSPWEVETFSQDSGYHDNEKVNGSGLLYSRQSVNGNHFHHRTLQRKSSLSKYSNDLHRDKLRTLSESGDYSLASPPSLTQSPPSYRIARQIPISNHVAPT